MNGTPALGAQRKASIAVLVAALGYFVDVYDLVLFGIVRVESLKSIGVTGDDLLSNGVFLLNSQMIGMLLGGVLWGILGDKLGRIQVLFGSILLYSLANLANAFVQTVDQYALLRLLAGIGLAGEIGAGITLVSELMSKEKRGYGTTIIATVGVSGGVVAGVVGDLFMWRTAYIIGGLMGLVLLALRVSVHESGMFSSLKDDRHVVKGDLTLLFSSFERIARYFSCILVGVPIWFVVGIIVTFSPEIGVALGMTEPIKVARAVLAYSIGITVGDLASGLLSQYLRSRRKVIGLFMAIAAALSGVILTTRGGTPETFYLMLLPIGFSIGYWAVFVSTAAEQFGTNLRATVTTSVPNFVRGTTVLMTLLFNYLKPQAGVVASAQIVGVVSFGLAAVSLYYLRETFGRDLDFIEYRGAGPAKPALEEHDELPVAEGWR